MSTYTKEQLAPKNLGSAVITTPYLSAEAVVKAVNEKLDRIGTGCAAADTAVAIGSQTSAFGAYSTAKGYGNMTFGAYSAAEGDGGNSAGMLGFKITAKDATLSTLTLDAVSGAYGKIQDIEPGSWMMVFKRAKTDADILATFRTKFLGIVDGNVISTSHIPDAATTDGSTYVMFPDTPWIGKHALGDGSHVQGYANVAMEDAGAYGCGNYSVGRYSHTIGNYNKANYMATAVGSGNAALGAHSIAMGGSGSASSTSIETNAIVSASQAFGWSGNGKYEIPSERTGTFNINPKGGTLGFYIGPRSLSAVIREVVDGKAVPDTQARIIPGTPATIASGAEAFVDANIDKYVVIGTDETTGQPITRPKTIDEIKAEADHLYAYIDNGDGTYVYKGITTTQHKDVDPAYNTYEWRDLIETETVSYIKKQGDTDIGPLTLSGALTLASGAEFTLLCSNIRQTTTPDTVYNLSYKNSFLQAEEAFSGQGTSYGIACTGAKGYCILSVCPTINALKLSGDLSLIEQNMVCAYSYAAYSTAKSEFSTISAVDKAKGLVYFNKPFESGLASLSSKTEEENIQTFFDDDNALYCPRNPLIGNQVVGNFYANHAEGGSVKAIGKYSHAEGRATIADVRYSHAEGSFSFAGGMYAHAEGNSTVVHGDCSHAEGNATYAEGNKSHAEGDGSKAFGTCSHAAGNGAIASADNSWAWTGAGAYTVPATRPGSFNVNTQGGLSNFYVCSKSLQTTFNELVNSNVYVCENQAEIDACKKELSPTFEEIYNSWTRFGHYNGTQYGVDKTYVGGERPGATSWYYDSAISTICQPTNTTDFTGYVSNKKYGNYEFVIRAYSTGTDDDYNGIVAAFATDANGRQHTLSFMRTPNNQNGGDALTHHWFCVIDANAPFTPKVTTYGQKLIVNCTSLASTTEDSGSWSTKGAGALVSVVRKGNAFTAKTTKFATNKASVNKSELAYELTVDLDALVADPEYAAYKDVIELFRRPSYIGYCTYSQGESKYQNVEFPEDEYVLVNLATGKVEKFNKTTRQWDIWSVDPILTVGEGRFAYNDVTKKQFFNNGSLIFNVSSAAGGVETFSKTDTADISDTDGMIATVKRILMKLGMSESNITVG